MQPTFDRQVKSTNKWEENQIKFEFSRTEVLSAQPKVVQIERKTKGKHFFLCFSEMQPTFDRQVKGTNKWAENQILFEFSRTEVLSAQPKVDIIPEIPKGFFRKKRAEGNFSSGSLRYK